MNVFIISPGQDTGGQGFRIKRAFDRHAPGWRLTAMHASTSFIKYPSDLAWNARIAERLYEEADVVQHKNGLVLYGMLDHGQKKPTVVHHQGTRLRTNAPRVSGEARSVGAVEIVSTVDLLEDAPGSTWIPSPYDLDEIRDKYARKRSGKRVRIAHSPTNRQAKGTERILAVLSRLAHKYDIEVDIIENVEWRVCLSRKGLADIYIDQITLGYGNNAVEAMAMGIPVVSGWAEPADRARFVEQTGMTPQFAEANEDTLYDVLQPLIASREVREELGSRGRTFAEMFHAEEKVVERLKPVYESAPRSLGVEKLRIFEPEKMAKFMKAVA